MSLFWWGPGESRIRSQSVFTFYILVAISKPSQESRVLCAYLVANSSCSSFYSVAFSAEGCWVWHWTNCTRVLLLDILGIVGMHVKCADWNCLNAGALRVGMSWTFPQICSGHLHLRRSHPMQILKIVKTRNELALDWSSHHQSCLWKRMAEQSLEASRAGEPKKCYKRFAPSCCGRKATWRVCDEPAVDEVLPEYHCSCSSRSSQMHARILNARTECSCGCISMIRRLVL